MRTAAFQNGYFAALANRAGEEVNLHFSGESFAVDPEGRVIARGKSLEEDLVLADIDLEECAPGSTARRLFWRDRRSDLYEIGCRKRSALRVLTLRLPLPGGEGEKDNPDKPSPSLLGEGLG